MPTHHEQHSTMVTISTLSFVKVLIISAAIVFLFVIRDILAILFVALLLSSALSPWVSALERGKVPRPLGILLIYFCMIGICALALVLIIPPMVNEYSELALRMPEYVDRMTLVLNQISPNVDLVQELKHLATLAQSSFLPVARDLFSRLLTLIGGIVTFFLVFVVTFYMIIEESVIRKAIHSVTPAHSQPYIDELIAKIQKKIGRWLRCQIILSCIIFSIAFFGLTLLHVEYALILAFIAGLTEFMPVIGPILGSIPALFIAFNQSPILALWVLVLYIVMQRVENDFLVPRVMAKAVGINPLVAIISLMIGAKIAGFAGIVLAIPVATVLNVIISDFFGHDEISAPVAE